MTTRQTIVPPGQHVIGRFPRYGTHLFRPIPDVSGLREVRIAGEVSGPTAIAMRELGDMPRRRMVADFHCVAGWSAESLRWEGVPFRTLYDTVIAPVAASGITHVSFVGVDGFRAVLPLPDALE